VEALVVGVMPVVKLAGPGNCRRRPATRSSPRRKRETVTGSASPASRLPAARGGLLLVGEPRRTRASARRCLGQRPSTVRRRNGGNRSRARSGARSRESGSAKKQKESSLRRRSAAGIRRAVVAHVGGDETGTSVGNRAARRRRPGRAVSPPRERALVLKAFGQWAGPG
jgi:hypothetical protein